ncbi:MAG TPA: ABC transporter permease [Rhizomicrobium sp.]|nr:ABC transporter permease [Rhizomicrobium sp.]
MFHNYLITALRNFARHKLFGFINIAGLTVGLTCAIFIILLVRDELSYDKWIPGTDKVYRIEETWHLPGEAPFEVTGAPFPAPDAMAAQIPEIKAAIHLEPYQMTVAVGDRQFLDNVDVVSPNFFQTIRLPLVQGDPAAVFAQPESAVISESMAKKYFGAAPAVGKTLHVGGMCEFGRNEPNCKIREASVIVTGIVRDLPHNTQLIGNVFIPYTSAADPMSQERKKQWMDSRGFGYVELQPGANVKTVLTEFAALIDREVDPKKRANIPLRGSQVLVPHLTPFRDDHLSTDQYGGAGTTPAGSWTMVYGFAAIGVLILLVAAFNFTNLATARATLRAREISLRKVMGGSRRQLIVQFLAESVLTAFIALLLALAVVEVLLPSFDRLLSKPIQFHYFSDWPLLLALVGMTVLTGLIGGAYPALVLSNFRPAAVLRASTANQSGSGLVRTSLVVLQFAVSIGLGIAALVVFEQISFARTMDLGLNKDGVVLVSGNNMPLSQRQSFVRALVADPRIAGASLSGDSPFSGSRSNDLVEIPGHPGNTLIRMVQIDPGFLPLYGIRLLAGRNFSEARGEDVAGRVVSERNVVVNQAAARRFGYSPDEALGKSFFRENMGTDVPPGTPRRVRLNIIGVTTDFKFEGNKTTVPPTYYEYDPQGMSGVSVRLQAGGAPQGLAALDHIWHQFAPSLAIDRHFLDADFQKQFQVEEKQETAFGLFVVIAIFIACLGLFGLAAFSAERRTREIGLRKVFGARSRDIVWLLLWQFSIPVLIANLIAWPLAYYYLQHWLSAYAYRIALSPLYFLGAGAAALLIAWSTVYAHAQKVARANPVNALRYE